MNNCLQKIIRGSIKFYIYVNVFEYFIAYFCVIPEILLRIKFIYRREILEYIFLLRLYSQIAGQLLTSPGSLGLYKLTGFLWQNLEKLFLATVKHADLFLFLDFGTYVS